jgi:hypothetical protein
MTTLVDSSVLLDILTRDPARVRTHFPSVGLIAPGPPADAEWSGC